MQINVSPEVILSQLGYSKNDSALKQAQTMIESTKEFDKFSKHIISLHDQMKKLNAYVGFSNKNQYLKIKCDENGTEEILEGFHKEVAHWSSKYDVAVKQLDKKPIYYILGKN